MHRCHRVLFASVMSTMLAAPMIAIAAAPAGSSRHAQVDALFARWDGQATPGCALGIRRNGELDYARGYGMSNLEHGIPITPQSIFHVASISKQFTAFAIGLLAQQGKLSLDDDVRKYVREMPDLGHAITIAQLIHHTNGLREQGQLVNLAGWRSDDLTTEADILWALARQRHLNFAPGTEVVYGNAAYTVLAVIVRRVSGTSLRAYAEEHIFQPLGMSSTHFHDDHKEMVAGRTAAYSPRAGGGSGGWSISIPHIDHYGSTSLFSTVGDLLTWQQNLLDGRVGGPALSAWMQTSGALNDGSPIAYGSGLRLGAYRGLRMVSHDGADAGYRNEAVMFPDQKLAIVALCNASPATPTELTRKVAELYLGEQMTEPALAPALPGPPAAPAAWAGLYWSAQTDEVLRLEWQDGVLRQAGATAGLVPIADTVFRPADMPHEWRFTSATASAPVSLDIRDFWPTRRSFVQINQAMPDPAALAAYAGLYHSDETDMRRRLRRFEVLRAAQMEPMVDREGSAQGSAQGR
ncbi:serine hydrolase domain-containing protein [Janthinobacterium sp. Mn2066]|uniref:serine hydrolase domain-containing protein n=1 Tax=Janthinobacterium sp. Mn2066 TaxID=3395264 RepID=UPI003BC4435A